MKEAVAKRERETALEIAKNLLDVMSINEIAKHTGLTVQEVAEIAKR